MNCIFCHAITPEQVLFETKSFKLVFDIHPIQTGHLLLIAKDHYQSITQLPQSALHELIETEADIVRLLETHLPIDGVTLASNDKELMDDGTHFHVHFIPRCKQDGFWEPIALTPANWDLQPFLSALTS